MSFEPRDPPYPELKKSLIESLESMLPSEHNKQVVLKLNAQPDWAEKLKMLAEDRVVTVEDDKVIEEPWTVVDVPVSVLSNATA